MSNVEKIFTILNSIQLALSDLKVHQLETNNRLNKLEVKVSMLEADQASIISIMDKIASSQVGLFEKADRLEAKILKVEAGQTYINRKMDSVAIEDAKILKSVTLNQDEYKEELKRLSSDIEGLTSITKENVFTIAKLRHTPT